ncbi:MAG: alpha/beta hydrolase [Bacteroidota bacterium]|nr:alpha/beta hydrolase [Bacteroidota bacterium]
MKASFSYYILALVVQIKGIKKAFQKTPLDLKTLRKNDVPETPTRLLDKRMVQKFKVLESTVTQIMGSLEKLIIYVPGGAFVSGPAMHHWNLLAELSESTDFSIWMIDYPKAPEHGILEISSNMDSIYDLATQRFPYNQIILMGDSAGGTLLIALVQRLRQRKKALPNAMFLMSPVLDASFSNPKISALESKDIMLSKVGVQEAKKMCSQGVPLTNTCISPLYGSFQAFPEVHLFIAENDISRPDQELFAIKLCQANVPHHVYFGKGMPHIWPLLPIVREGKNVRKQILTILKKRFQ